MSQQTVWFSHKESFWEAKLKNWEPEVKDSGMIFPWIWDNCYFSGVKIADNKIRIIVRSKDKVKITIEEGKSEEQTIVFQYDFDIVDIPEIQEEDYKVPPNPHQNLHKRSGKRFVMYFNKEKRSGQEKGLCEIWEWVSNSDSELKTIREKLKIIMNSSEIKNPIIEPETNIQSTFSKSHSKISPII